MDITTQEYVDNRSTPTTPSLRSQLIGFTLLELLVVVSFIAVLTGMVLPIYNRSMYNLRLRNFVQDVTAIIRYAQEKAVAEGREFRVMIDEKDGSFQLYRLKEDTYLDERDKEFEPVLPSDGGTTLTLPANVTIQRIQAGKDRRTNKYYISCYPSGACDPGELQLQSLSRTQRRITIRWLGALGRFEIK